jgi:hypothetical protein
MIVCFVCFAFVSSGQSKKEQILTLSNKIDSLNSVLNNERSLSLEKITKLNFKSDSIEKKLNTTKAELLKISKDFDKQKVENESLSIGFKQLESELISLKKENAKLKLDSLTKNRFKDIDKERLISINNKPLVLFPFEIFEIMTFSGVVTGSLNASLDFFISDTGEQFSFLDNNNIIEMDELDFEEDPKTGFLIMKGEVAHVLLKCDCDEENLRRSLVKNRKYKVIYSFKSDSELWRKPFPTESSDGYYIVDILELNQSFEREKEWGN